MYYISSGHIEDRIILYDLFSICQRVFGFGFFFLYFSFILFLVVFVCFCFTIIIIIPVLRQKWKRFVIGAGSERLLYEESCHDYIAFGEVIFCYLLKIAIMFVRYVVIVNNTDIILLLCVRGRFKGKAPVSSFWWGPFSGVNCPF